MKFLSIALLSSLLSASAFAKSQTLICMMGDAADMDITIETLTDSEKLSVIVYGMDGNTRHEFVNSHFKKGELSFQVANGEVRAIVSKSDLQDQFGGAYSDAGSLSMIYNKKDQAFDVQFAANNLVYTASCKE